MIIRSRTHSRLVPEGSVVSISSLMTEESDDQGRARDACRGGASPAGLAVVALVSFGCVAVVAALWSVGAQTISIISFLSLMLSGLLVYYGFFTDRRSEINLALPAMAVLLIQSVVYPLYILWSGQSRVYWFAGEHPNYASAMLLWALAIMGFGVGIGVRARSRRDRQRDLRGLSAQELHVGTLSIRQLLIVTIPLVLMSLLASYMKYRTYGVTSLAELSDVGVFAADSIRRNRGLGPWTLLEMWSYVSVAYVGWHAFLTKIRARSVLLIGVGYSILGSGLALLNARRGALIIHLVLLGLPFALAWLRSRRWALLVLPVLLAGFFYVDLVSAELRTNYYQSSRFDVPGALASAGNRGYAPMSFNHLEMSASLLDKIERGSFQPLLGTTFVAAATNLVPRSLWPGKPWTGGPLLSAALGGQYYFDDSGISTSYTTGLIVEVLMNFGLFSYALLPPIMFGVGYVLAGLDVRAFAGRGGLMMLTAFSVYFWSAVGLFSDDMGGVVTKFVMNTTGLLLLGFLLRLSGSGGLPVRRRPEGASDVRARSVGEN